jgi:Domain of unknown function (DUF4331)
MSHHPDYPADETLDISDAYCFAGPGDLHGPRTVFGMNTSPFGAPAWNTAGYYELKIDTNGDYVEDITFRATFPAGSDGTQYVQVEQLTGAAATDRTASGPLITPPNAPIGEVVECSNGITLFAGPRLDPFRNFIPYPVTTTNCLAAGTFPDFASLGPPTTISRTPRSTPACLRCPSRSPAAAGLTSGRPPRTSTPGTTPGSRLSAPASPT